MYVLKTFLGTVGQGLLSVFPLFCLSFKLHDQLLYKDKRNWLGRSDFSTKLPSYWWCYQRLPVLFLFSLSREITISALHYQQVGPNSYTFVTLKYFFLTIHD